MPQVLINYWAVLVAAIVAFAFGWVWHGPLFGKQWMKLMGYTAESMKSMKMKMNTSMALGFITTLVTAYVLAIIVQIANAVTVSEGMRVAFWVWLGFYATTQMGAVLWENRSWSHYKFNTTHSLISLLLMGGILASWV